MEHETFMCSKMYGWEYTRLRARSASGFIFFDDGEEDMSIERRKDAGCEDVGLLEERGQ